jgi:hypothetical protein
MGPFVGGLLGVAHCGTSTGTLASRICSQLPHGLHVGSDPILQSESRVHRMVLRNDVSSSGTPSRGTGTTVRWLGFLGAVDCFGGSEARSATSGEVERQPTRHAAITQNVFTAASAMRERSHTRNETDSLP